MGWSYRRSTKIAPGVRLNVSRRALGLSVGPRHAKVSANTRGRRTLTLSALGFLFRRRL